MAKQTGVKIGQIQVIQEARTVEAVGLQRVVIEAEFPGDYLHLMRFINALERDPAVLYGR